MAQLLPNVYQRFADLNNVPLAGGKLYSYQAGTNTLLATYTDQGAGTPNSNPVILDSAGGAQVWITNAGYKLVLTDVNGVVQWSVDNVYLIEPGAVGSGQIANGAVGTTQLANGAVTTAKIQTAAITTALLASGSVTTGVIAAGSVTIACLDPNLDLTQLASSIEIVFKRSNDLSGARFQAVPQFPWSNPIQQPNPLTLPAGQGNSCKWSPDGRFFAVCHVTSPYVTIYERSSANFIKLPDPATTPAGVGQDVTWSPNGDFLVVAHNTTPFITIYQRQGINFTKLSDPGTLPAAQGVRVKFSPNGEFMAVSSATDFQLYNVNGTTFTSIVGSSGISSPDGIAGEIAWSNDSQYLALSNRSGTGNLFNCYQRTGLTFTAMTIATQPSTVPNALMFTPDGANLIGGYTATPNYTFYYTVSGSTLTFASNPFPSGSPPAGPVFGISISPNGTLIAVVSSVSPYLQIYSGSFAGGWTLLSNPATIPITACNGVDWGPTNQWLGLAVNSSPNMYTYLTASSLPSKGLFYCRNFADV
jgi:WD40 repeat protein